MKPPKSDELFYLYDRAAHYAAIEYMKKLPDTYKPAPPLYTPPVSKSRRVMQSWRLKIYRVMKY